MKLLFLYGPPAAGKLTIAKELEKVTGFRLLHNHLVRDLVETVLDKDSPTFSKEKNNLYLNLLTLAAKGNTPGIIFTFCYNHPHSRNFIKQLVANMRKHKGSIYFIQILCDRSELIKRVSNTSRKKFKKIQDPDILKMRLEQKNFFTRIPYGKSLVIDNTSLSSKKAAKIIMEHVALNT